MVKYILISRSAFLNKDSEVRQEFIQLHHKLKHTEIKLLLVTRNENITSCRAILKKTFGDGEVLIGKRFDLSKKFIEGNKKISNNDFIMIGSVEEDIRIVANNKIVLFNPTWLQVNEKIVKYGFRIESVDKLIRCIDILNLENKFMFDSKINEKTTLIALCDAREYYAVADELEMLKRYKGVLKFNQEPYQYAVYFHYVCNLLNDNRFKDVDYWMAVPSSSGSNNNYVYEMVANTRYLMNDRKKEDLFIRHKPAKKSTYMNNDERINLGCTRHFDTIHLNPKYKGKLTGKKICVIDDYVTNGTSFETIRNLLENEGVKEIILLAIGSFKKPYIRERYKLEGNVYEEGYNYELLDIKPIRILANDYAQETITSIYNIIS